MVQSQQYVKFHFIIGLLLSIVTLTLKTGFPPQYGGLGSFQFRTDPIALNTKNANSGSFIINLITRYYLIECQIQIWELLSEKLIDKLSIKRKIQKYHLVFFKLNQIKQFIQFFIIIQMNKKGSFIVKLFLLFSLGFYLTESQNCTAISQCLFCTTSSNSTNCTVCDYGYQLFQNSCNRCSKYCIQCQYPSGCSLCQTGYVVSQSQPNQCIACNSSCAACFYTPLNCTLCSKGFTSYPTSTCQIQSSNLFIILNCPYCLELNGTCGTLNYCSQCNPNGYVYYQNKCVPCQSNCAFCLGTPTNCQYCIPPYAPGPNNTCVNCNIKNCYICSYNSSSLCLYCMQGYYLNQGLDQCFQCLFPCSSCSSGANCSVCSTGYYLNNTFCQSCTSIPNCVTCNYSFGGVYCNSCEQGYNLTYRLTCFQCGKSLNTIGCNNCTINNIAQYCNSCQSGYNLQNGTCILVNSPDSAPQLLNIYLIISIALGVFIIILILIMCFYWLHKKKQFKKLLLMSQEKTNQDQHKEFELST